MTAGASAGLTGSLAEAIAPDWRAGFDPAGQAEMRAIVRTALVDTAACILAGRDEPATRVVRQWLRAQPVAQPHAVALCGGEPLGAEQAALLDGVAAHVLDFDDVGLAGHPSAALVPALLAARQLPQARTASDPDLVQAYAKGYAVWADLQARMKVSLHARGWHPSAVFGTLAATAAVGALQGLDAARLSHALGIAASLAGGVIANFGSMAKPLQVGRAAQAGLQAVTLAQAGMDASPDALDGKAGLLVALSGGPERVDCASPPGERFARALLEQRPGIKKYPACYAVHRVIDGVLDLLARHGFAPEAVERVDAEISETTAGVLRHHRPARVAEARFSMEATVALALVHGRLGMVELSEEGLADSRVQALVPRVHTRTTDTHCPLEPSFALHDAVTITLRDGRRLESGPIRFARGHAQAPLARGEVEQKLFGCAGPDEEGAARQVLAHLDALLGPADGS